jgi:heme/copper-type cytochrome/quinol oxidase subunit 3
LLNTLILLIRGLTATLAHQELLRGKKSNWIFLRILLGFYFLSLQAIEYFAASFMISSGAFGRIFFFGTGFHGLHVCLGAIMLAIRRLRTKIGLIRSQHHFSLEFSLWYWHFVDVVWLFLFFWVYTWGC